MDAIVKSLRILTLFYVYISTSAYNLKDHPCCNEQAENLTLAMVLDPFEIYGHDPADKLDHLLHYQTEMYKIRQETDQIIINEHVHIATDHLERFVQLQTKELKVLMIALDDVIDNMGTMYDNHNALKAERFQQPNSGGIPVEFYVSQEFYCGKNVYLFVSELYSDIFYMGRHIAPYCKGRAFYFLGFVHHVEDDRYYLEDDIDVAFPMDDYHQGLECHLGICIYRFPHRKNQQHPRDVVHMPKAISKCGLVTYKLPPLTEASCMIASGSFIFDFNIQGIKYRHHDFVLTLPNGRSYYTKEKRTPLVCHYNVCEWKYTNYFGGPFDPPGMVIDPPAPPIMEVTTLPPMVTTPVDVPDNLTVVIDGCWYMFPPNYGSIAGISYLDPLSMHDYRYTCQGQQQTKSLYYYPRPRGGVGMPSNQFHVPSYP